MSRADAATGIRSDVFADGDLPRDLKLFTLAAIHLWETAEERRKIKRFGSESWAYRALRMCGYTGTKEELSPMLRNLIREDVPKYRVNFRVRIPCVGTMLRPAGAPCTKSVNMRSAIPNPLTGERTLTGACRNPRHEAQYEAARKAAWAAWRANGEPEPKPNSGGLLLRYFTSGIDALYEWADRDYRKGDVVAEAPSTTVAGIVNLADRRTAKQGHPTERTVAQP